MEMEEKISHASSTEKILKVIIAESIPNLNKNITHTITRSTQNAKMYNARKETSYNILHKMRKN